MADFTGTTTVDASQKALFAFLSDVSNLPRYFARMTSATPGNGEEVHTTAQMPDGTTVEGDAWFRVDDSSQRIEWGSEGASEYHGAVDVRSKGDTASEVEVHVHTTRVEPGDSGVQEGVETTLAQIKRLVEDQGAAG
jgi:uncharacterized membrane protein